MVKKLFIFWVILALSFGIGNAIDYTCDTSGINPVSPPETTDKAWVVPLEYSKIPLVVPFDGSPTFFPINDSVLAVVPFNGDRPRLYAVQFVKEIPKRIFDDVKIMGDWRVIFIPIEDKTIIVKLWKEPVILPHGHELAPVIGITEEHVYFSEAIVMPITGLADEPLIIELKGDNIIIPLEGGSGGLYIRDGSSQAIFRGRLTIENSLIAYVNYRVDPLFVHLISAKDIGYYEFTEELKEPLLVCCL